MKSLQDYIDIYKDIATKLNLQGDSIEVLTQMLANASYISEVENISYAQESSLEKATLINSKIQLCVDDMYSVFRGACPRVILNIKPTKEFSFEMFQKIVSGNGYDVYYLGYYSYGSDNTNSPGTATFSTLKDFIYSPITMAPAIRDTDVYTIVGLLCKSTVSTSWTVGIDNTYYVDCLQNNLSNDVWVKIENNYYEVTREFSDHIINGSIFDLTLPSFGSRLYISDIFRSDSNIFRTYEGSSVPPNTKIDATYYVFSTLDDYNKSDLKKINIKGSQLVSFSSRFISMYSYEEFCPGIILVNSAGRDDLNTIHYKASRDRYVNSIMRSNSDIGVVLEEMYPDKIRIGGTSYKFESGENSSIDLYYVPINKSNPLTETEIQKFISSRSSYYITDGIRVNVGDQYTVIFNLDLEIYQNVKVDDEVKNILNDYSEKFNVDLDSSMEEIKSLISKISNVKQILDVSKIYMRSDGTTLEEDEIKNLDLSVSYYQIDYIINSVIR